MCSVEIQIFWFWQLLVPNIFDEIFVSVYLKNYSPESMKMWWIGMKAVWNRNAFFSKITLQINRKIFITSFSRPYKTAHFRFISKRFFISVS